MEEITNRKGQPNGCLFYGLDLTVGLGQNLKCRLNRVFDRSKMFLGGFLFVALFSIFYFIYGVCPAAYDSKQ